MREIEIKAKVKNKPALLKKLAAKNIKLGPRKTHHDVVFSKPGQKDYEEGSIWLRIRTETVGNERKVIWTLKGDTGRKLDSIEHEVEVSDATELEKMLRHMGHELYSDLTKTRQKAKVGELEICIDEVEGLGTFIEVEKLFEDHNADHDKAARELWDFLEHLGIGQEDQETLGYDVLLKGDYRDYDS